MAKRIASILLILFAITGIWFWVHAFQSGSKPAAKSGYPAVVAEVAGKNITGRELASEKQLIKNNWAKIGRPQSDSWCERAALRTLVLNSLLDYEASKKGIKVTGQEALNYLEIVYGKIKSLSDNNPAKISYLKEVKSSGFSSPEEYIHSPEVLNATQKALIRSRLRNRLYQSGYSGTWQSYEEQLLDKGDYRLFVNVDIKNFVYPKRLTDNKHLTIADFEGRGVNDCSRAVRAGKVQTTLWPPVKTDQQGASSRLRVAWLILTKGQDDFMFLSLI